MKKCAECGLEKKETDFTFITREKKLRNRCKKCVKARQKELRMSGSRVCLICGVDKPKQDFNQNGRFPGGLHKDCKECQRKTEQQKILAVEEKECSRCHQLKKTTEFYKHSHYKGCLLHFSSLCIECFKNKESAKYKNPELKREIKNRVRLYNKKNTESLSDKYVKERALDQGFTKEMLALDFGIIPMLRAELKLKRKLRNV